jgi:hypothetical protein
MAARIFINYRRDDSSATAGRLHDRLVREFGKNSLFMDVDNMPAGIDFVTYLNSWVESCDLFLALIGPRWLDAKNAAGGRRLDDPEDYVTIEIAAALRREIPVVPVLADGARMPKSEELPEQLKPLVRRHAVEIRNAQFGRDADALVQKIREALRSARPDRRGLTATVAATAVILAVGIAIYQFELTRWVFTAAPPPFGSKSASVLHDQLFARMAAYSVPSELHGIDEFVSKDGHKAIAVSPDAHRTFWSANWPTAKEAEVATLEGCQIRFDRPCVLIATDDAVAPDNEISRATRDMERVRYEGKFDPQQIPKPRAGFLDRPEVANYASAPDPKAAAFQTEGDPTFATATGAPSQYEAEARALERCYEQLREKTACFLYAIGNQVVLPKRARQPLTARPPVPAEKKQP